MAPRGIDGGGGVAIEIIISVVMAISISVAAYGGSISWRRRQASWRQRIKRQA